MCHPRRSRPLAVVLAMLVWLFVVEASAMPRYEITSTVGDACDVKVAPSFGPPDASKVVKMELNAADEGKFAYRIQIVEPGKETIDFVWGPFACGELRGKPSQVIAATMQPGDEAEIRERLGMSEIPKLRVPRFEYTTRVGDRCAAQENVGPPDATRVYRFDTIVSPEDAAALQLDVTVLDEGRVVGQQSYGPYDCKSLGAKLGQLRAGLMAPGSDALAVLEALKEEGPAGPEPGGSGTPDPDDGGGAGGMKGQGADDDDDDGAGAGAGAGVGMGRGAGGPGGGDGGGSDLRLLFGAAAALDIASLPSPAPGVSGYLGLQYDALYLRLEGAWFAPQSIIGSRAGLGGLTGERTWRGTELAYGTLRGCWAPTVGPLVLGPCAGLGLGAFVSELPEVGTDADVSRTDLLVAPRVGGVLIWPIIDLLALTLGADLAIHANAPTLPEPTGALTVDGAHEVNRATFVGTLGLELRPSL